MLGVEPEELIKRPMDYFIDKYGGRERFELITKRYHRYERIRCILLSNVREQRASIIEAALDGTHSPLLTRVKSLEQVAASDGSVSPSEKRDVAIDILMKERQRLDRFERQQAQEVERLLQYEINLSRVQQELVRKEERQKREEAARARDKMRRQREADEKKRQVELSRPGERRREIELARNNAQENQGETLCPDQPTRQDEEWRRRDASLRAEYYQLQQRQDIERKQKEMVERDSQRRHLIQTKREQKAQEIAEKQRRNKMRIMLVLKEKEEIRAEQLRAFERKQEESEARRQKYNEECQVREQQNQIRALQKKEATEVVQRHLYYSAQQCRERSTQLSHQVDERLQRKELEKHKARLFHIREQTRKAHKRKLVHRQKEEQLQQKQASLIRKVEEKAMSTRSMQEQKKKNLKSRYEDALLRDEELQAALARREKADAYRVSYLLERIAMDDEKSRRVRDERNSLLRRREEIKRAAEKEKLELVQALQKLKIRRMSHGMASRLLDQLQSTKLSGIDITSSSAAKYRKHFDDCRKHKTADGNERVRPRSACSTYTTSSPSTWSGSIPLKKLKEVQSDTDPAEDHLLDTKAMDDTLRDIQKRQNRELIDILEEEYEAEIERQNILDQQTDLPERLRLENQFNGQRMFASERIKKLTQEHEHMLHDYIQSRPVAASNS